MKELAKRKKENLKIYKSSIIN